MYYWPTRTIFLRLLLVAFSHCLNSHLGPEPGLNKLSREVGKFSGSAYLNQHLDIMQAARSEKVTASTCNFKHVGVGIRFQS